MKIGMANAANGQIAGTCDLASLFAGNATNNFACLLDLGSNEPELSHRVDETREKPSGRSKGKEIRELQPSAVEETRLGATPGPLSPQTLPSVDPTPWQFESAGAHSTENDEYLSASLLAVSDTPESVAFSSSPSLRTITGSDVNCQRTIDDSGSKITSIYEENDPQQVNPSKGKVRGDAIANEAESIPPPPSTGSASATVEFSSLTPGVVRPSAGTVDRVSRPASQVEPRRPLAAPMAQRVAVSSDQMEYAGSDRTSAGNAGGQLGDHLVQSEAGEQQSSGPLQGAGDTFPDLTVGGHAQGGEGGTHRGTRDASGALVESNGSTPRTAQGGDVGVLGSGSLAHGQSPSANAIPSRSLRESAANAQLNDPALLPVRDGNAARLLGSAMRSDLRVGVQTEAFGRVTIQTSAQGGQLSAQLSLENAKEGATIAAHLPAVERRIVQEHGVTASVRLVGGFEGGTGAGSMGRDQSGSDPAESRLHHSKVSVRQERFGHEFSNQDLGVEAAMLGSRYPMSSRLDVTV